MPCCAWALSPKTILRAMAEGETVRNAERRVAERVLSVGNYKDWAEQEREDQTTA